MNTKQILVIVALVVFMVVIATITGNWAVEQNPDGLKLHSPSDKAANEARSAFGFGASFGLLGVSLLYCLLAAGTLLTNKLRRKTGSVLPVTIAIIAAIGFTASYVVDGYFY